MRIAHLTDFHMRNHLPGTSILSRRLSRRVPDLLASAVDDISRRKPDLVALTGDLLDYPFYAMHDPELRKAAERDLRLVREILLPLTCPLAVVFGNHDHPDAFTSVFGDLPPEFTVCGHRVLTFYDREVENHIPQRMGPERERFLTALGDGDPRPQIHIQHYLVSPDRNEGYPHTYLEAGSIRCAMLEDPRVRLVLSGHYHRGEALRRDGHVHFATAPAICEPPHPYWVYTLGEGGVTQESCRVRTGQSRVPRRAVFLDRDGVINPQPGYRTGPEPFCLIDGVGQALARLREAGFALVVVSNQTAVGHGYVTAETVGQVNDKMASLLTAFGVVLDGVYCRYHSRDAVVPGYRTDAPETKPSPAMLHAAADDLCLNLSASFIVGDRRSDLQAGHNAGCLASVLVRTGSGGESLQSLQPGEADHIAENLPRAAAWILSQIS